MSNPRDTAIKLITQAVDSATTEAEARTFALKAAKIIVEHKLLGDGKVGFGSFREFLTALPVERIAGHVNTGALGAAAIEILQLKAKVGELQSEVDRLRGKLRKRRRL